LDTGFNTKISERRVRRFKVGLLLSHDGIERPRRVEIRLLNPNGHSLVKGALVLNEQFTEMHVADQAGI
jgi:hypothetical protein